MANVIWADKARVNSDGSSGFMRTRSVGGEEWGGVERKQKAFN